jgi:2-polyprenyl-3-methyl-5-hydroxy-6-metoxy-1,4-benzoquinol methylase
MTESESMTTTNWTNIHIPSHKVLTGYHREVARLVLEHTPTSGSVLDVGAGLGHVLQLVTQSAPELELHAADSSDECLEVVRQNVPHCELHTLTDEPESIAALGASGFDTCVMSHLLEHTRRPIETIEAALSVLKPHGRLIIAVPNPSTPHVLTYNAVRLNYVNRGHVCCWDRSHWMNFLQNIARVNVIHHGQDEVRVFPQRISSRVWPLKQFEHLLSHVVPRWAHSHISVVERAA